MDRGGHEERIATAYDLLARRRSAGTRSRLSLSASARSVGVSRSRFYQHWETADALADDLAIHRATGGWQARTMAHPSTDVFVAIREALHAPNVAAGAVARAVLSAEPIGTPAHAGLHAWERTWLNWLAGRLRERSGARPDVPWTVAAATISALVEGALLLRGPHLEATTARFDRAFADLVTDTAAKVADYFPTHVVGTDEPLVGEPAPASPSAGARRLLDRVVAAVESGKLPATAPDDRRVISLEIVARELGQTPRAVLYHWPTPAALNADLLGEALRRLGMVTDLAAMTAFTEASISDPTHVAAVLVHINERLMDLDDLPEPLVLLALMDLLDSPEIAARYVAIIQEWCNQNEMRAAAILQATDRRLAPGIGLDAYAALAIGTGLGGWRLGAANRDLLSRRCTYLGEDFLTLAAGLDIITQVCLQPT